MQARSYDYVNRYELPTPVRPHGFYTLVGKNGIVAWMPDNEQQHLNPQYRKTIKIPIDFSNLPSQDVDALVDKILKAQGSDPVTIDDITQVDVARMLKDVVLFKTKRQMSIRKILTVHETLIERMLHDLRSYRPKTMH